ncbi:MAG: hypothetical protein F4X92_05205, partial [Gammaproteobacteria bacterium]|nr:hypothetical protein [Gammaproteobacteria bacterium]
MIDSIYVNEGANLHDNQYNRFGREKMSTVSQRYKCIVIDPPWDQGKTGKRSVRPNQGANLDYPTMNYDEIAAVPVAKWADDEAFLWLWATNSRSR